LPGEVELDTGLTCDTSPQIRGAIKSLDGVLDVQEI
jgi:DNA polymerase-3 subunit alpha